MKIDPSKLHMMKVDEAVESYTVGVDYLLDRRLVEADCFGSCAHAAGLAKIGVLSAGDGESLREGLREIVELSRGGEFGIKREQEDCHTAIEAHLTATLGEVGQRFAGRPHGRPHAHAARDAELGRPLDGRARGDACG